MSDPARLIEKFGLAIHGEDPQTVMTVLVAFSRTCCEQWGVPLENFARELLAPDPDKDVGSAS